MILAQLFQKSIIFIGKKVIKSDSRADEYFFNSGESTKLMKQLQIIPVVCNQIFTRLWKQTLFVCASSVCQLFFAGRRTEISSWSAYIVNISFEFRVIQKSLRLFNE